MICLPDNVLGELVGVLLLVDVAVRHQELLQMVLGVSCVAQKNDPSLDQHSMVMVLSHKMALEKIFAAFVNSCSLYFHPLPSTKAKEI